MFWIRNVKYRYRYRYWTITSLCHTGTMPFRKKFTSHYRRLHQHWQKFLAMNLQESNWRKAMKLKSNKNAGEKVQNSASLAYCPVLRCFKLEKNSDALIVKNNLKPDCSLICRTEGQWEGPGEGRVLPPPAVPGHRRGVGPVLRHLQVSPTVK